MKRLAILMLCALSCAGHKITELLVPLIADPRRAAELSCHFSMDDQRLHSVKWYRDMHEIFRYNPQQKPQIHLFNVTGIMVQSGDCSTPEESVKGTGEGWCVVRVMPPPAASRAAYTCEVSTEGPKFLIARQAKHMTVVALPDSPPLISGAPRQARAGEQLVLNCSTDYSLPPQDINWYIDGVLQKEEVWDHTSLSAPLSGGLRASWRVLRTRVSPSGLRAQCEAVLHALDPPVLKRSAAAVITVHSSTQLEKYTSNDATDVTYKHVAECAVIVHYFRGKKVTVPYRDYGICATSLRGAQTI